MNLYYPFARRPRERRGPPSDEALRRIFAASPDAARCFFAELLKSFGLGGRLDRRDLPLFNAGQDLLRKIHAVDPASAIAVCAELLGGAYRGQDPGPAGQDPNA